MATTPAVKEARLSKENVWYLKDVGQHLNPAMRELLEGYSEIPPEEIEAHIYKCRDIAWEVYPFPCIGNFWFLKLGLSTHPAYQTILAGFRTNPALRFLDLGTCFGQDLRKLAFDGAPAANLHGCDLHAGFEAAGHALFRDADAWRGRFIAANVLADSGALVQTQGTWDVVHIAMFLHVFSLDHCKKAAKQILRLLRRGPGSESWVVGTQSGSVEPGEMLLKPPFVEEGSTQTVYRHSKETFCAMWEEVAQELGMRVELWAEYAESDPDKRATAPRRSFFTADGTRRIVFSIKVV